MSVRKQAFGMWPFGPVKTLREIEAERFPELVVSISVKWPSYLKELEAQGMGRPALEYQLATFGIRAADALRKAHFALHKSDDRYFMLAVAAGIIKSGAYPASEVEHAAGFKIPFWAYA